MVVVFADATTSARSLKVCTGMILLYPKSPSLKY